MLINLALITVRYQPVKSALADPVDSLRYEKIGLCAEKPLSYCSCCFIVNKIKNNYKRS